MVPRWLPLLGLGILVCGVVPTAVAQREAPHPTQTFAEADQLYNQRLYPSASTAFAHFRQRHPSHPLASEGVYLDAKSALALDRDARTRRLLNTLQRRYPSHPRAQKARLGLAQYYLEEGNLQQAKTQLTTIADTPHRPAEGARALYLLGRIEQRQGRLESALSYYDRAHKEYPDASTTSAAVYAKGVTLVQLKRFDQATTSFEILGREYPDSPFSQNLGTILGEVYYRLDRYEKAAMELQKRLPNLRGKKKARALFLLGECYTQSGQGDAAITQYQLVLQNHPNSPYAPPARFGLARQYYSSGQHQAAAEAFAKVRRTSSSLDVRATYYEAVNRSLAGATTEALQLYRTFVDQHSDGRLAEEARYETGLLLYQQQKYDEAAAAFRNLVRDSPSKERLGEAYYWLGNAYLATEQLDRALEAYNQALKRNAAPASVRVEVQFQKAWSQYQNQRYDEAASAFLSLAEAHSETTRGQEALFWGGDSQYQQGNYSQAQMLFQRYLQKNPEGRLRTGAHYALAWTHFKQRRFEAAARQFRRFLEGYSGGDTDIPYQQDARLRLADSYFALKRYDAAIAQYRRVGGKGTDYALYQTGKALYYADRSATALKTLRRFVERNSESPWRPDALYRIGDIHFQQQDYEAARTKFRQLIEEYPDHELAAEAQYAIGDAFYNAGEMKSAVEAYRTVLETYPESATANEAASSLFFALNAAGQQDRADDLIASIAKSNPEANLADRLRFHRARAAFQSGQSKRALTLFQEFVRTSTLSALIPSAYYHLGLLYADLDRRSEAKNYLRQLVTQFPDSEHHAEGALRLGKLYFEQKQYQQAVEAYRVAAEDEQTGDEIRAQARYGQAMSLLRVDRMDEAEALLSQILDSEDEGPLLQSARLGLGRIRQQQGRTSAALDRYRTVLEGSDSETGAEALFRLGRLLREQDQPRKAIQELERMPSLFAGYPEWEARALLEQARAYRDLGETGQAVQLYDEVLKTYAGTPFAETARTEKQSLSTTS